MTDCVSVTSAGAAGCGFEIRINHVEGPSRLQLRSWLMQSSRSKSGLRKRNLSTYQELQFRICHSTRDTRETVAGLYFKLATVDKGRENTVIIAPNSSNDVIQ